MRNSCHLGILFCHTLSRINYDKDHICTLHRCYSTDNTVSLQFLFNLILSAKPCCINKDIFFSIVHDLRINGIPCCSCNVTDDHTLLSKKYEKQVQTCWYGEQTSTLEVKLFVNLEAGICRVWFYSDGRRDAYKERWYSTLGKRTYNAIAETVKNAGFEI